MKRTTFLTLFLCLSVAAFAASPPPKSKPTGPKPARDGAKFLFIMDTSASMKSVDSASRQTVFDLIFSGVDGYMQTGDTFGVWTFNEQIGAGRYPMKVWDADNLVELAGNVTMFIREQEWQGDNRIDELMVKISAVSRAITNVNVLIISDGDTKMQGTPFDLAINGVYSRRNKERKAAKKPFITTLVVDGGKIVNGFVTLPGEPLALPPRTSAVAQVSPPATPATNSPGSAAAPEKPLANFKTAGNAASTPAIATIPSTEVATAGAGLPKSDSPDAAKTPSVASTTSLVEDLPAAANPSIATPIATNPPRKVMQITTLPSRPAVKHEETAGALDAKASMPEQSLAPTGSVVVATTLVPANPDPTPPSSRSTASEPAAPSAVPAKSGSSPREAGLIAVVAPTPVVVAAREPSPPPVQQAVPARLVTAVQVPASPGLGAIPTLIFGGILLAMALFLLGIALRRMRHEPQGSLITQSMHRR